RSGIRTVTPAEIAGTAVDLDETHDLVLIEGAGGLLVRFADDGATLADVAWALHVPVVIVASAGAGAFEAHALAAEVLLRRGVETAGVIVGSWPASPDLAARCNLEDLPVAAGAPLLGVLPEGAGGLDGGEFVEVARAGLSPWFGGEFDPEQFGKVY